MTSQPELTVPNSALSPASREEALSDLFVTLADTLVADFDVVELLDELVATCVGLFGVSAAGVLIFDAKHQLRLVASSNDQAEHLEVFQLQNDEGPCLDCARSRTAVSVPDLHASADRWPRFSQAAEIVGLRAVHAVPLRLRTEGLGGFGLFHNTPTALSDLDLHAVQALADVATIGILQQQHAQQATILTGQLQGALDSRIAVEQAKGILAEAGNLTTDAAFTELRRYCRDRNLKLSHVAQQVASQQLAAASILQAGSRHGEKAL